MSQNSRGSSRFHRRSSISSHSSVHSNSTISDSAVFSQRIVSVDCYTAYPISQLDEMISDFRGTEVKRVPVIRIYGATPRGQKTCTHVHGVFPYIYIEDDSADDDFEYMLALALDNAINSLFNYSGTGNKPNDRTMYQHVFKIARVTGRSFFGYKSRDKSFLQIFFYSPISLKKGVELLESGRILGRPFQPFEAHIPYILQFFLDYKLYGMNFVHFRDVKFRRRDNTTSVSSQMPKTPTTTGSGSKTYWDLETMPDELLLPAKVTRRCRLELEIDVKASDILISNSAQGKNPGIVDIWLDEKERRRQNSMSNWANITIPQSPERTHEADFIFPREAELLEMLRGLLSGDKDVSSLLEASQSQSQNESSSGSLSPASKIDARASLTARGRRTSCQSLQSDDEIIDLLEDIAVETEENDSILQSSQHRWSAPPSPASPLADNQLGDDEDVVEDEWTEDFLSQTTLDLLDKWEQERNNDKEDCTKSYDEFQQCDGQACDSDNEMEVDNDAKRRKLNDSSHKTQNSLPLTRRSTKSQSRPAKTITSTQFKNKILSQSKVLIVGSDSGSESDCQVVEVLRKTPPRANSKPQPQRLRSLKAVSIELTESDEEEDKGSKPTSTKMRLRSTPTKKVEIKNEPSPSSSKKDLNAHISDRDSGITSFYDVSQFPENQPCNGNGANGNEDKDSDSSQEILPASPVAVGAPKKTSTHLSPVTNIALGSPAVSDSLVNSIYHYGDESFFNDEDLSQSEPSQDPNKSFQDIVVDFSVPNQDSSENVGFALPEREEISHPVPEEDEREDVSDFRKQKILHQMARKVRREQVLAMRSMRRPSVFPFEMHPLKQVPLASDVEKWRIETSKDLNVLGEKHEEPLSLTYVRGAHGGESARNKLITDVLRLSKAIEKNRNEARSSEAQVPEVDVMKQNSIGKPETLRVSDSEDSEEETPPAHVRAFRFRGAGAGDESASASSGEDADDDDNDTMIASPASSLSQAPSPATSSQDIGSQGITPKSILVNKRRPSLASRKKRLDFQLNPVEASASAENSLGTTRRQSGEWPRFNSEDSELDSVSNPHGLVTPKSKELNSSNLKHAKASHEHQFLTTFAVEVHCSARGDFVPDPEHDSVLAIFYAIHHDSPDSTSADGLTTGLLLHESSASLIGTTENGEAVLQNEALMIQRFIDLVQSYNPDILVGYEIEKFSWGYLIQRGFHLGVNMLSELSRILPLPHAVKNQNTLERSPWNESINGRIVLNLWKLLRHELAVTSYTYENMVLQILRQKVHRLPYKVLDNYWHNPEKRSNVKKYFNTKVVNCMRIIDKLDLINRTSELARLFGIQFFEVLSRGSQFRVESMMLRLTKPVNLIPPSPNPMQRARMKAPEYLPLILEPESKFYTDPVAVLDFQSLYPSMMIAYNYCFSTCIGRLEHLGEDTFDLGPLTQEINKVELARLFKKGLIHISPCRVVFVKPSVRKGILSTMLEQILDTRQMVKRSMKKWKDNETLQKVLDSRQLGLKLIANVTYGYTSANFSGRMPCVEIADSIVSKGRETLQRAIDYVKENEHVLGGKVVYGDTDSLFVHFPGKTRQEAFTLAQQIVDDVTQANPKPVKLKLEKVYQPCILQTKKRYVGFAYETPDQKEPKYDAKGIETVRRDGCPATAKILEGTIRVLFAKQDENSVREFVTEQFRKIFLGRVSLSNYTFARKFRGRHGYKPGARVPSLEIAKKLAEKDRRAEPLPKERVPYIVTYGNPWAPLIERVRRPEEFINDPGLRLNAHYYIEKAIIPALNRCLNLAGFYADKWLLAMPRKYLKSDYVEGQQKKGTIDQYFVSQKCIKCELTSVNGFCEACFKSPESLKEFLAKQSRNLSSKYGNCLKTCQDCSGESDMLCINMDCPVKHKFLRYERDYRAKLPIVKELQNRLAVLSW